MPVKAFLIGGILSGIGIFLLYLSIGVYDTNLLIIIAASFTIASIYGCAGWIVQTIKENKQKIN